MMILNTLIDNVGAYLSNIVLNIFTILCEESLL